MKLPILKAFGATYALVFGHFFDCLRIVWLPLAVISATRYWVGTKVLPALADFIKNMPLTPASKPDFAAIIEMIRENPIYHDAIKSIMIALPIALIFTLILITGLLRFSVRGQKPQLPFYIGSGADEIRLALNVILVFLATLGVSLAGSLGVGLVATIGLIASPPVSALITAIASFALDCVMIWFAVRLSLANAATIGERTIGFGTSLRLTGGNFWRLLIFWILVVIPIIVIGCAIAGAAGSTFWPYVAEMLDVAQQGESTAREHVREMLPKLLMAVQEHLPLLVAIGYVSAALILPIVISADGKENRKMTRNEDNE